MKRLLPILSFSLIALLTVPGCMVTDGTSAQRRDNKCCGVIKCDMHRRSQTRKHKRTVNAHKSLRKKEQRIKRGW